MEKTPFWKKTWFIILMFWIVPPLGIVLMWTCKKDWKNIIRIILSVIFGIWALLWGIILFVPADESSSASNEPATFEELITEPFKQNTDAVTLPVENTTAEEPADNTETETTEKQTTAKPTTTKAPSTKPVATTKKVTTTAKPTTTKAPTTVNPDSKVTVYRTETGKRYHYENPCGNGTYYPISLADAKSLGLTPCDKCVLH